MFARRNLRASTLAAAFAFASLVVAGKVLLALTTDSVLYVLSAGATGFAPVAQYQVAKSPVWAHPAVSGSILFVKAETTLSSLSLKN